MRVVSSQSDAEIRRRETRDELRWALRELTANLMRIVNGTGRPVKLMTQMAACVTAFQAYVDAHESLPPSHEVHNMLDCDLALREYRPWIEVRRTEMTAVLGPQDDSELMREEALKLIRKGALQVVASMLLDQLPQQSRGESDIYAGVRELEAARAKGRSVESMQRSWRMPWKHSKGPTNVIGKNARRRSNSHFTRSIRHFLRQSSSDRGQ